MAYCTKADIQKRVSDQDLIDLTSEDPDATVPVDDIITEAIDAADEEIDSYVGQRYTTPLSPVPGRILDVSRDIAIYNLYARRPEIEMSDTIKDRYKGAVKWLDKLSNGKVSLGDLPEPAESDHVGGRISGNDRLFTRDNLDGF